MIFDRSSKAIYYIKIVFSINDARTWDVHMQKGDLDTVLICCIKINLKS